MAINERIFGIIVVSLILLFSIIHLAVGVGIIAYDRHCGDILQPQIGLSGFNLVIAILAFGTSLLCLYSILSNAQGLGKITAILSGVLGIFALASLIAALVINSQSATYVSTSFLNTMANYRNDLSAKTVIDHLQIERQCCGDSMWLDWSSIDLNSTSLVTATVPVGTDTAFTTTDTFMSTTVPVGSSSANVIIPDLTSTPILKKDSDNSESSSRVRRQLSLFFSTLRRKRDIIATYGSISGLPIPFGVVLPGSCCTSTAIMMQDATGSYCISNATYNVNQFYTVGCSKSFTNTASSQTMGIGVINCFMIILAIMAILILFTTRNSQIPFSQELNQQYAYASQAFS